MLKNAYEIDVNGYYKDVYLVEVDKDGVPVNEAERHLITVELPQPNNFIRIKWDGEGWVEGASQQELDDFDYINISQELIPTPEQLADSELEIKVLTILLDMGVI